MYGRFSGTGLRNNSHRTNTPGRKYVIRSVRFIRGVCRKCAILIPYRTFSAIVGARFPVSSPPPRLASYNARIINAFAGTVDPLYIYMLDRIDTLVTRRETYFRNFFFCREGWLFNKRETKTSESAASRGFFTPHNDTASVLSFFSRPIIIGPRVPSQPAGRFGRYRKTDVFPRPTRHIHGIGIRERSHGTAVGYFLGHLFLALPYARSGPFGNPYRVLRGAAQMFSDARARTHAPVHV